MPTISIFYGVVIQMFWREHNPPHFHAIYAGEEVIIDIRTLQVVEGAVSRRALAMVLDWATRTGTRFWRTGGCVSSSSIRTRSSP